MPSTRLPFTSSCILPSFCRIKKKSFPRTRLFHERQYLFSSQKRNTEEPPIQRLKYDRDTGIVSILSSEEEPSNRSNIPLFQTVIGLEVHAQLSVPTKLFSSAPTKHHPYFASYTNSPNHAVHPHDIGYMGTLPLISQSSIQKAVLSAAALNCDIQRISRFERKHYHYADLPLGYQVTQQRWPFAKDGSLTCRRWKNVSLPPSPSHNRNTDTAKVRKRGLGKQRIDNNETSSSCDLKDTNNNMNLSKFFTVGIHRVQIEQDTGKTTSATIQGDFQEIISKQSFIDFNRAGSTLIEIVFLPQIHAAHEAASVVSTLQSILKFINTCDAKMEEGSLRCDLNVSLAPVVVNENNDDNQYPSFVQHQIDANDDNPFQHYLPLNVGNRVEVKNLNSIRQIIESTEYEALRQAYCYLDGNPTTRETRTYDPKSCKTIKIRDKGGAVDYRFMPEPDLPPLILDEKLLQYKSIKEFVDQNLIELPEAATSRLMEQYNLSEDISLIITSDQAAITFYEDTIKICQEYLMMNNINDIELEKIHVTVANWLCNDLFSLIKDSATKKVDVDEITSVEGDVDERESTLNHPISVTFSKVQTDRLGALIALILEEAITTTQGKKLLSCMFHDDLESSPSEIAKAKGWKIIKDPTELKDLCKNVVLNHPQQLKQYFEGGKNEYKIMKFFVGKIMSESMGNAHPELMKIALIEVLTDLASYENS